MPGYANKRGFDYLTEVALGAIEGHSTINKYGEAPDGVQTTATDIWSRADSVPTQQIWLAPTAARVHALVSSNAADTQNVTIYGLKTWDLAETSEVVTLNGTTPVNTANSYVIIHRMKFTPTLAKPVLLGTVTATAATDGTITAVILPGDGQTEMAIYGVPSIQTIYIKSWRTSIGKSSAAAATANFVLRVNENPNVQTTGFLRKDDMNVQSNGSSSTTRPYDIPISYAGPCIVKVQAIASAADVDGTSGFDGYVVNN